MAQALYELDVRLNEIEPPIWRTVEVPGAWSLEDVHYALQVAMGWTNSHLHQFVIANTMYGMIGGDDFGGPKIEDERGVRLQDLVRVGDVFSYEYDFGDSWEHAIRVSKVTFATKAPKARCTAGARACPPEDCGGVGGYEQLLAALADPRHAEHDRMVEWSADFAPEQFELPKAGLDLGAAIKRLRTLAEEDEPDEEVGGAMNDAVITLPRELVELVLSMPPMERAALGSVISESLATELLDALQVPPRASRARAPAKKATRGKRRS